ncbi:hypothetical protein CHU72_08370 [Corynebacterium sp. LK12]|nr:hypothetical protein CHU72_08370 [Corynebacterium sp. LK12]
MTNAFLRRDYSCGEEPLSLLLQLVIARGASRTPKPLNAARNANAVVPLVPLTEVSTAPTIKAAVSAAKIH